MSATPVRKIVISAHGDTNWQEHHLVKQMGLREGQEEKEVEYYGHMDNFGGVHATMKAYFTGELPQERVRIEITYGEETGMDGAREVAETITPQDVVIVVDVTGTVTTNNIVIEKCSNQKLREFVTSVLQNSKISYEVHSDCPDAIMDIDETNVYSNVTDLYFFLGLPVRGGDYNEGPVYCFAEDIEKLSEALILLTREILDNFKIDQPFSFDLSGLDNEEINLTDVF